MIQNDEREQRLVAVRRHCGLVSRECADVGGDLGDALKSFALLREGFSSLQLLMQEANHRQSAFQDAVLRVRQSTDDATARLHSSTEIVSTSVSFFEDLLRLVEDLGQHVEAFSEAMEDVRRSSRSINEIAETTSILALNASIEANRAGEHGRTFSVVAEEVKALASQARTAADDITKRTDHLRGEGTTFAKRIAEGSEASSRARASIEVLQGALGEANRLVSGLSDQSATLGQIHHEIERQNAESDAALKDFDNLAQMSEAGLEGAASKMSNLELMACDMFDQIVKSGLSEEDSKMVRYAMDGRNEVLRQTDLAIEAGQLSKAEIFDVDYHRIAGSEPARFETALKAWADEVWRPILDATAAASDRIVSAVCIDEHGYLPTHMSQNSRSPTGDLAHDTQFCRDGRRFDLPINRKAFECAEDYMMSVYRHEGDGREHRIVRSVYVPLHLCGERWGSFQISYVDNYD